MKKTTLKDIAREIGVSTTTVSKVLNNSGSISKKMSSKILDKAREMNYSPNLVAKSMRIKTTNTIGVVISDSSHSFFPLVIQGIEEAASKKNYNILLCNTHSNKEIEKNVINVLLSKRVDGIILVSSMLVEKKDLEFVELIAVPIVYLIRRPDFEGFDIVTNDNFKGSRMMVDYLLKTGSKEIYYINLPGNSPSGLDRLDGYKFALMNNDVKYNSELIFSVNPTIEDGYNKTVEILKLNNEINTIYCGCDIIAIGVIEAILEKGLRIPEDIRVASYDDIEYAQYLKVPLTTIKQPKYEIGSAGFKLLLNKISSNDNQTNHIVLEPKLIIRKST